MISDLQEVAQKYQAGRSVISLCREYGVSWWSIHKRLKSSGCKLRTKSEQALLERKNPTKAQLDAHKNHRLTLPDEDICKRYQNGASVKSIACSYGISRGTVVTRLNDKAIQLRTASEQSYLDAAAATPSQRLARVKKAHDTIRGVARKESSLELAAQNRQKKGLSTPREQAWADALSLYGISTVPQFAIGRYNFDLAVPHKRVLIDVQNGWHKHKAGSHRERDKAKRAKAEAGGWKVFWVYDRQLFKKAFYKLVAAST